MKKIVNENGQILLLSPTVGIEITDQEYEAILQKLAEKPKESPEGYTYRLSDSNLTWELCQIPEDADYELTAEEALDIIVGGGSDA